MSQWFRICSVLRKLLELIKELKKDTFRRKEVCRYEWNNCVFYLLDKSLRNTTRKDSLMNRKEVISSRDLECIFEGSSKCVLRSLSKLQDQDS